MAAEPSNTSLPLEIRKLEEDSAVKVYPYTVEKLSEDNAHHWFQTVKKQLYMQGCWQAIEYYKDVGNTEYSRVLDKDSKWFRNDLKADSIIEHGLSSQAAIDVNRLSNAGQKWDYLQRRYLRTTNTRKAMKLMRLASWTWDKSKHSSMQTAFEEITQMAEEFIRMNGDAKIDIRELSVMWFLRGIGNEYSSFRNTIMHSNATLTQEYMINQIIDEDAMRAEGTATEKASRVEGQGKSMKCFHCGQIGHRAKKCPTRQDETKNKRGKGKGQNPKPKNQKGRAAVENRKDSFEDITDDNDDDEHANLAVTRLHDYAKSTYASETAYRSSTASTEWCFDSGATSMSTGNRDIFEFIKEREGTLTIANGLRMPIKGRGTVKFSLPDGKQARLDNVIYVPGLAENLLSLEVLHKAGFVSVGSKDGYDILKNGTPVAKGKRTGYSTYLESVTDANALLTGVMHRRRVYRAWLATDIDEIDMKRNLIHSRLGHPGRNRFNNCVSSMDMDELRVRKRDALLDDKCEVCIKAKQVKAQSHKPVPRARHPLKRVYMDFWGPNREGIGEERYYLSLIDDYTRYSWLFLAMDRKTESIIHSLEVWLRMVERQSGKMLLVIRTDNAREFIALQPWAEAQGIEIEFIEAETPPQNGVAERFNRLILEIARALLIDACVDRKYWKYAVKAANYLRNRTTLVKMGGDEDTKEKTPYELWFGHPPDISHLRRWGCRVLYHHKPDSKLESRVMEGTFMMYAKSDKQYYVLPRGASQLKLVTNPEFREREFGYLDQPSVRNAPLATTQTPMISQKPPTTAQPVSMTSAQVAPMNMRLVSESNQLDTSASTTRAPHAPESHMEGESSTQQRGDGRPLAPPANEVPPAGQKEIHETQPIEVQNSFESERYAPGGPAQRGDKRLSATPANEVPPAGLSEEPKADGPAGSEKPKVPGPAEVGASGQEPKEPERRSTRVRQPSKQMIESQKDERTYGRKRRAEGEGNNDRPTQRFRAHMARLAIATELLIDDHEYEFARALREKAGIRIPRTYSEAINDAIYGTKWKEAIHKELSALVSFGTWNVIPRKKAEAENHTISTTRWVFDIKLGPDGRIDRFKARLVARGNEQSDDDFNETFAPVFRLDSLRILVAIAARYGMIAHLLDATNAFVGSDLDKPNCMEIPEGLQDFDPDAKGGMVLELKKSLYGLRQSANLWHRKISCFLQKIGFRPITADPSVFINGRGLIAAVYVDDVIIFGKDANEIDTVKQRLKEFHPMTDSGRVQKLLGIRFTWMDGSIRLDQEAYAREVLDEFGMVDCNPSGSPMSPSMQLSLEDSPRLDRAEHKLFRRLIGRLIFMVVATRPDIAFAVNQLSQYLAEPRRIHLAAGKHLLRYVKGTITYGITFGAKGRQGLIAYADSAYANSARNRSTTGFIFMLDGAPIAWASRKQSITAQSSTEAEYMAVSEATKQAIWVRHFLYAIGKGSIYREAPTTIYEDNQGAIKIAENPINHPKTKHIAVRYHAIRDHMADGEVRLEHLPTTQMVADGLTKATNHVSQARLVGDLGLA